LKAEERKLTAELLALRLRELERDSQSKEGILRERDTAMQGAIAGLRSVEAEIETVRQEFTDESEAFNGVQGRYYQIGAEISRNEQAIQHGRELRQRQRQELEQAERGASEGRLHLTRDQGQIDQLATELATLEPEHEAAKERTRASAAAQSQSEESMQDWQERWEDFNRDARAASEQTQVERARIEQLEHQIERLANQRDRLTAELEALAAADTQEKIAAIAEEEAQVREAGESANERVQSAVGEIQQRRERERSLVSAADESRKALQEAQGKLMSLEALQQAALGLAQGKVTEWLESNALSGRPRLAQELNVEAGWERAVETVLGGYLEAVCVDTLESIAGKLDTLRMGTVTFFAGHERRSSSGSQDRLQAKVQGPDSVDSLLAGIIAVDDLSQALSRRGSLAQGESVITRDGIWIGPQWLRVSRDKDVHAGVLGREKEMRDLREAVSTAEQRRAGVEAELETAREQIRTTEARRDELQAEANRLHRAYSDLAAQVSGLRAKAEQAAERHRKLTHELEELQHDADSTNETVSGARERLEEGLSRMAEFEDRRHSLEEERDHRRQDLSSKRLKAEADREQAQEVAIRVESKRSAHSSIAAGLERLSSQLTQLESRSTELKSQLDTGEGPLEALAATLEEALQRRIAVEQELAAARSAVDGAEARMGELTQQRGEAEARVEEARTRLEDVRMAAQELKVRRESVLEQFAATHFSLDTVLLEMVPEADIPTWDQNLTEVSGKIERLGSVNLAAIDEFKEQSERKEYLDRQFKDLTDALETLDEAIRKIDRETRSRFQDTFDRVNAGLKERFPRLFGGGHAYLELAGEDILSAGVSIMARPPGKRNSTINQLSGGEKALTAVALVFSIFELNPAPFCLLDEVDAPLDDNNVGRFCDTVKDMAQRVQFIFITHNKVTMELASQLLGVTMNEPGVSRLVAVDVDEAVRMAAM
jgi:chromosome segregation protein